jgi:hypothetical protein
MFPKVTHLVFIGFQLVFIIGFGALFGVEAIKKASNLNAVFVAYNNNGSSILVD